jgi:PII-like signaling protein
MTDYAIDACAVLKVGLWNGSETCERGRILYQVLLKEAMKAGIRGGTTSGSVEGSRSTRTFRTVESEVGSNALPVFIEFVDNAEVLERWIPQCKRRIQDCGVIVVEGGQSWGSAGQGATEPWGGLSVTVEHTREPRVQSSSRPDYNGLQVQIYTLEQNTIHGKPVYQAVAELLRDRGILWISTTRGVAGFGAQRRIHQAHWLFRRNDVPVVVTVLDKVEKLDGCLAELVAFVGDSAFVVSKPVVWHHP